MPLFQLQRPRLVVLSPEAQPADHQVGREVPGIFQPICQRSAGGGEGEAMPKMLVIHDCTQCKFYDFKPYLCLMVGREIPDPQNIPTWCPLSDAPAEKEECK